MQERRGIVIHPQELDATWPERLQAAKLNVLGLHPVGGQDAHKSLEAALHHRLLPETKALLQRLNHMGVEVEYEAHTMSWLLPRALFSIKPQWFRMNAQGERTADYNFCPSNEDALEFVSNRAEMLARMLDTGADRFFFWMDDVHEGRCCCPRCKSLSFSDQQLMTVNAMLRGVRRYNRQAKLCFLAYMDAMEVPAQVAPLEGVILEYAPFNRDTSKPLFDAACEKNASEVRSLQKLLTFFGQKDAQVLEYWMDNSMFSGWKKPPRLLTLQENVMQADVAAYRALGFESITSFGCFLGEDYRALYGEPPVKRYGELLNGHR